MIRKWIKLCVIRRFGMGEKGGRDHACVVISGFLERSCGVAVGDEGKFSLGLDECVKRWGC